MCAPNCSGKLHWEFAEWKCPTHNKLNLFVALAAEDAATTSTDPKPILNSTFSHNGEKRGMQLQNEYEL